MANQLRIVIDGRYINDAFPGIGRYTYNLIVSLAENAGDDRLIVLANSRLCNRRYDMSRLAALPACQVVDCQVDRFLPSELLKLAPVVHRLHPDLFHSPFFLRPYPLASPCIHTIHDLNPMQYPDHFPRIQRIIFGLGMRMAMRKASAILTISELSAKALRWWQAAVANRIFVTPLAPDPSFSKLPAEEVRDAIQRLGLGGDSYALHVSSGLRHKNIELLLHAWNLHLQRGSQGTRRLVLAGNYGRRYARIAALAKQLGIENSVSFLGNVDDKTLAALYNGADIFVFPSSVEGFGLPVVEAMACGAPVLTTDVVGAASDSGDAVWAIPANALDPLVDGLDRLLADEELRRTLSSRGLARAQSRSWHATARATWQVYRSIAGNIK